MLILQGYFCNKIYLHDFLISLQLHRIGTLIKCIYTQQKRPKLLSSKMSV